MIRTKGATENIASKKYLRKASGDAVAVSRTKTESNPLLLAKKGIASSLQFDDKTKQSIVQISGHHSTWPKFDFDTSYGVDVIFETE